MNPVEDDLRELFEHKAGEVPPHGEVPRSLRRRFRRRMARNAAGALLAAAALAAGALGGLQLLRGAALEPAGRSTSNPSGVESPSGSTVASCSSAQLRAVATLEGAAGSRGGAIVLTNLSGDRCTLQGRPSITLLDPDLTPITSGVTFMPTQAAWQVDGSPEPVGWPVVTLRPGGSTSVRLRWSNWCPDGRAAPLWQLQIPDGGSVDVLGLDGTSPPPCNGPGQPSSVEVGPFEPA